MTIKDYVGYICVEKKNIQLKRGKELEQYKKWFYSQPFKTWKLDIIWEYIWNDRTLEEITRILNL